MSDDTAAPKPAQTGPFEHYCQYPGCTKWGGFGYARGKGESDWFCYEHRPEKPNVSGDEPFVKKS